MHGDPGQAETTLLCAFEALARKLSNARAEIAAIDAGTITASHIPSATDELDAIAMHTAAATNNILTCCETLDLVGASLTGRAANIVQDVTTQIYEACAFQDITGQRITKIVATLQFIERKVADIIAVFGKDAAPPADPGACAAGLPALALDQAKIDALLASAE
jgi:chemotaxis protein CheZ